MRKTISISGRIELPATHPFWEDWRRMQRLLAESLKDGWMCLEGWNINMEPDLRYQLSAVLTDNPREGRVLALEDRAL